jgi:hypothetical protein
MAPQPQPLACAAALGSDADEAALHAIAETRARGFAAYMQGDLDSILWRARARFRRTAQSPTTPQSPALSARFRLFRPPPPAAIHVALAGDIDGAGLLHTCFPSSAPASSPWQVYLWHDKVVPDCAGGARCEHVPHPSLVHPRQTRCTRAALARVIGHRSRSLCHHNLRPPARLKVHAHFAARALGPTLLLAALTR